MEEPSEALFGKRHLNWPLTFDAPNLSLELTDVLVHLGNHHLCVMAVIPVLPSQYLQLLVLDLICGLGLSWAAAGSVLILNLDLGHKAFQFQGTAVVCGQDHGHV